MIIQILKKINTIIFFFINNVKKEFQNTCPIAKTLQKQV